MTQSRSLSIIFIFFSIFLFVSDGEARKVRMAVPAHSVSFISFAVAKEKGYYLEEGLDVELILMASNVANMALIGGDVDFSGVPAAGLTAFLRGAPLRALFSAFNRPLYFLYTKPEIRQIRELKGKKVGLPGFAGVIEYQVQSILEKHGMGLREVTVLAVGAPPNRYAALVSGAVDATVMVTPWNIRAHEAGFRELLSFIEQDYLVDPSGSAVVRMTVLQSDPELVERFIKGTIKGHLYARENRSGAIPILARYLKVPDGLAANIYDTTRPAMTLDGTVSDALQKSFLELVLKVQGMKESPSRENFFDNSLAQKIYAELKGKGWKSNF